VLQSFSSGFEELKPNAQVYYGVFKNINQYTNMKSPFYEERKSYEKMEDEKDDSLAHQHLENTNKKNKFVVDCFSDYHKCNGSLKLLKRL